MAKSVERNHPDFDIKQDDLLNLQPVESLGDLKKGSFLVYYRMTMFDANGVRGEVVHQKRVCGVVSEVQLENGNYKLILHRYKDPTTAWTLRVTDDSQFKFLTSKSRKVHLGKIGEPGRNHKSKPTDPANFPELPKLFNLAELEEQQQRSTSLPYSDYSPPTTPPSKLVFPGSLMDAPVKLQRTKSTYRP
jgi:hypothetical protein